MNSTIKKTTTKKAAAKKVATKKTTAKKTTAKKAVAKKATKEATKKVVKKPVEKKAVKKTNATRSFKTQESNSISSGKLLLNELETNLLSTKDNLKTKGKEIGDALKNVGENAKGKAGKIADSANQNYQKALTYTKNNPKKVAGILAALVGIAAVISSKKGKGVAKGILGTVAAERIIKKLKAK